MQFSFLACSFLKQQIQIFKKCSCYLRYRVNMSSRADAIAMHGGSEKLGMGQSPQMATEHRQAKV